MLVGRVVDRVVQRLHVGSEQALHHVEEVGDFVIAEDVADHVPVGLETLSQVAADGLDYRFP